MDSRKHGRVLPLALKQQRGRAAIPTHCAFEFSNGSQKCIFDASSMGCVAEAPLDGTGVRIHEHGPQNL